MKFLTRLTLCGVVVLSFNSCFSTWISKTGLDATKIRSRSAAVEAFGQPVYQGNHRNHGPAEEVLFSGEKRTAYRFEIYKYHGMVADPLAYTTGILSEVTLGTSELMTVPWAVGDRMQSGMKTHYFLAEYDNPQPRIMLPLRPQGSFQLFDLNNGGFRNARSRIEKALSGKQ